VVIDYHLSHLPAFLLLLDADFESARGLLCQQ